MGGGYFRESKREVDNFPELKHKHLNFIFKKQLEWALMIYIYNPSIWETEVGLQVQSYLDLHTKPSQKIKRSCLSILLTLIK